MQILFSSSAKKGGSAHINSRDGQKIVSLSVKSGYGEEALNGCSRSFIRCHDAFVQEIHDAIRHDDGIQDKPGSTVLRSYWEHPECDRNVRRLYELAQQHDIHELVFNAPYMHGNTPLMQAALEGKMVALSRLLELDGIHLNKTKRVEFFKSYNPSLRQPLYGWATALDLAALVGQPEAFKKLREEGVRLASSPDILLREIQDETSRAYAEIRQLLLKMKRSDQYRLLGERFAQTLAKIIRKKSP